MHGSIIGGVGLLLFSAGLALLANKVVAVIFALAVAGGAAFVVTTALDKKADTEDEYARLHEVSQELMPFCEEGTAFPDNAPYDGETGYHPVIVFNRSSSGSWGSARGGFPDDWTQPSAQETELIGCVQTDEVNVESCAYDAANGRSFYLNRVQYRRTFTLYTASDRAVLTTYSELGSEPSPCPDSLSFSESEFSRNQTGTYPDGDSFLEHIEPWVMGTVTPDEIPESRGEPPADAPK